MSDLRTLLLESADSSDHTTTTAVADADLVRARRVLRQRRSRRMSAGSALVAAAAVGAFVIVSPGSTPKSPSVAQSTGTSPGVKLVAYTGTQPSGYTLDKVPTGWRIDDDDLSVLTLAPAGTKSASLPKGVVSLKGKIAVMTESDTGVPTGVQLDDVRVDGRPGVIAHMDGDGDTRTLFVKQPSGVYLEIQVWSGLGWDNQQIAEFGSSVHINAGARTTAG
jgi:hypothetical protein